MHGKLITTGFYFHNIIDFPSLHFLEPSFPISLMEWLCLLFLTSPSTPFSPPGSFVKTQNWITDLQYQNTRNNFLYLISLCEFQKDKKDELQVRLDHSVSETSSQQVSILVGLGLHSSLHGWPQSDQPARFSGTTARQAGARCRQHGERLVINVTPGLTPDVGTGSAKEDDDHDDDEAASLKAVLSALGICRVTNTLMLQCGVHKHCTSNNMSMNIDPVRVWSTCTCN